MLLPQKDALGSHKARLLVVKKAQRPTDRLPHRGDSPRAAEGGKGLIEPSAIAHMVERAPHSRGLLVASALGRQVACIRVCSAVATGAA